MPESATPLKRGPSGPEYVSTSPGSGLTTLIVSVVVITALYFAQDIFIPLALGALLSFILAPLVLRLRRWHLGRVTSVVAAVTLAFLIILAISSVIAGQLASLASNLPQYQENIEAKVKMIRGSSAGIVNRASSLIKDLGREIAAAPEPAPPAAQTAPAGGTSPRSEPEPIPVVIKQPEPTPVQVIQNIAGPLLKPLATTGIVVVFTIFMLLQREDLRDRVIRLAGAHDIQRTTEAIDDAARRVSRYLVANLVVNATYGLPVGLGLWAIGVPNPILWGILATLLRFIPYIGPWIAAFFPLALAVAVDEGWTMVIWAAALFIVMELISNNVVEPWLYGSSTGLSAVAVIVAATFWTWLWGPVGLLLSTPLTSCLVVLGRHVPQLQFLDVLLGNRPVLAPEESFYQRMLAGDPDEAADHAEEYAKEHTLSEWYDEVALKGLALAGYDRARGTLDSERLARIKDTVEGLTDNLSDMRDGSDLPVFQQDELPPAWRDSPILIAAGRGPLDEAAGMLLADLLRKHGIGARVVACEAIQSRGLQQLELAGVQMIVLSYLDGKVFSPARYLVRRLKRMLPRALILVGFWTLGPGQTGRHDPLAATGADLAAISLRQALAAILESVRTGVEPRAAAE
jgi:predicted PurR-regulated permease PerM